MSLVTLFRWRAARVQAASYPPLPPPSLPTPYPPHYRTASVHSVRYCPVRVGTRADPDPNPNPSPSPYPNPSPNPDPKQERLEILRRFARYGLEHWGTDVRRFASRISPLHLACISSPTP